MRATNKYLHFGLRYAFILAFLFGCSKIGFAQNIALDNGQIALVFNDKTGELLAFKDLKNSFEFISPSGTIESLWEIEIFETSQSITLDMASAQRFHFEKPDPYTLILIWDNFSEPVAKNFKVSAVINLEEKKPFSAWKIEVSGTNGRQISQVAFPKINGIKNLGDEHLAVPLWMGIKMKNPRNYLSKIEGKERKFQWEYPGRMSLQCIALYNDVKKFGLYVATDDASAYKKSFSYSLDSLNHLNYKLTHYPSMDANANSYAPSYKAIIGSFAGDWISAAEHYSVWGSKQNWATESRLKKGITPERLEKTALWEWNRGTSNNVLTPAKALEKELDLPVNVLWHWWHGCSYDDGFPEYFPPREGKASFIEAIKSAQAEGVESIVYMNQMQWGTTTESWKNEHAEAYAVKDIHGNLNTHTYNVFTNKSLTTMCMGTKFWKDKFASLSDAAINQYQTNGVYMDQACSSFLCYDITHGHSIGGGNYWLENFGELTEQIRSVFPENKDIFLAGEGVSEAWLPYLDAFLALQVSMERYAGDSGWEPIPFFQAVYHPYAITFGNYSSLIVPPYDELWPKTFEPKDKLALLDESFNRQFMMEQARSFVWGLQPTISNYQSFLVNERKAEIDYLFNLARVRYNGLKYLLHGKFLRSPEMDFPEEELQMSRLSIYAGKTGESITTFKKTYPLIFAGTWQAEDNDLGIALASISDSVFQVKFSLDVADYQLPSSGSINMIGAAGKEFIGTYENGKIDIDFPLQAKQICIIEIGPSK